MLSEDQIKQFQIIYKRHFNEDITKEKALEKGISLINLLRIVCRPINKTNNQNYENYDKLQSNHK